MSDLISRQAAIDALKETDDVGVCWKGGYVQRHSDFEEAIDCIKELPSAEPEPKKGEKMKIGDAVFVHGYVDEIRNDTVIIRNRGGYFGTTEDELVEGNALAIVRRARNVLWENCKEFLKNNTSEERPILEEYTESGKKYRDMTDKVKALGFAISVLEEMQRQGEI